MMVEDMVSPINYLLDSRCALQLILLTASLLEYIKCSKIRSRFLKNTFSIQILMPLLKIINSESFKADNNHTASAENQLAETVSNIISRVANEGDKALFDLTSRFDGINLNQVGVPPGELGSAESNLDSGTRSILEKAIDKIRTFHTRQKQESWQITHEDGTTLGEKVTPLDRVGIYVPGGKAFYPSTMIMNAIPAQIAGVKSIVVASPPTESTFPHPLVLAIGSMLGLEEIVSVGGAQAIAAMAYGTETISPVCKVTGPGNRFVAEAKKQVFGRVGIDSIAGPSEIVILHDNPEIPVSFLVRDLLTQAEHDEDACSILITTEVDIAEQVQKEIDALVPKLPRKEIIEKSLVSQGKIIVVDDIDQGIALVNEIAPEHLELMVKSDVLSKIRNAGAIFIGKWSSETIGDYFAGPNHTIPTSGAAKFGSPLSVRDFQKHSSIIEYSRKRLQNEAEDIIALAELEGLTAHADAVRARIKGDTVYD
jgi:histidinol dehydrogenase